LSGPANHPEHAAVELLAEELEKGPDLFQLDIDLGYMASPRSLTIREDEPFQHKLRAKLKTRRGRAALRKRTAVERAISHHVAHQGRRARYKGLRKNQFDGRRHAAVSNLQVAARYAEARQLAS
jgi:hypothetical protein